MRVFRTKPSFYVHLIYVFFLLSCSAFIWYRGYIAFGVAFFSLCLFSTLLPYAFSRLWITRSKRYWIVSIYIVVFLLIINPIISIRDTHLMGGGFSFDDTLGWRGKSNLNEKTLTANQKPYIVSTNSLGHRTKYEISQKQQFEFLVQGDSNAFGFGLSQAETLCDVIENKVDKACYNASVSGYDFNQYYFQFNEIKRINFSTRIILTNLGNDITTSVITAPYLIPRTYLYMNDGVLVRSKKRKLKYRTQNYGYQFIPPYERFNKCVSYFSRGQDWADRFPSWVLDIPLARFTIDVTWPYMSKLFNDSGCDQNNDPAIYSPYYRHWISGPISLWPRPYRDYVEVFKRVLQLLVNQSNHNVIFVVMPLKAHILGETCSNVSIPEIVQVMDNQMIHRENKSLVVNMIPQFCAHLDPKDLFQKDRHLSAAGIALIAERIIELSTH